MLWVNILVLGAIIFAAAVVKSFVKLKKKKEKERERKRVHWFCRALSASQTLTLFSSLCLPSCLLWLLSPFVTPTLPDLFLLLFSILPKLPTHMHHIKTCYHLLFPLHPSELSTLQICCEGQITNISLHVAAYRFMLLRDIINFQHKKFIMLPFAEKQMETLKARKSGDNKEIINFLLLFKSCNCYKPASRSLHEEDWRDWPTFRVLPLLQHRCIPHPAPPPCSLDTGVIFIFLCSWFMIRVSKCYDDSNNI